MMQITQLGPYTIKRQIGKGGMGSVYEASDANTGQRVAIKALSPHLAEAEGFRERFEAEIESLKTLTHEGIVRLYGFGEQDGILFYSMELIDGPSLEDELKAGRRFDWHEVSDIAIQLCGALKNAHDHGIIHRDIKPANILFANDRQVKLADFGIARLFGNTNSLTAAGGVLGTADYMSPEQADGRPVTARCDQYSLGGVMYALLAGRPPFRAKTLPEMLQMQRFADPEPVSRYAPDTPKQLESVIAQLLAKEPAERFPNTAVLARHLQAMVMALTRPAHDSFSLAGDGGFAALPHDSLHNSLALAVTQAETDFPPAPSAHRPAVGGRAERPPTAAIAETLQASAASRAPVAAAPPAERPTVFTTVEEDLARRAGQQSGSWLSLLGPLVGLAVVIAALAALGYYLAQPPSADQLYHTISNRIDSDDLESMRAMQREIDDFVARFPKDGRADELRVHQQQLELDRMHRQLLRRRGGANAPALQPVEALYLQAMNHAQQAPETAISQLQSLVALYGSHATGKDADERVEKCVQLAKRQLAQLQTNIVGINERQLVSLQERMETAERLRTQHPAAAGQIYQAIIELFGERPWAAGIVVEAREKLAELPSPDTAQTPATP